MDNSNPTAQDLLDLATELNDLADSIEPLDEPLGHFTVAPVGWGSGSIGFLSWGPGWNSDTDDRPQVDLDDEVSDDPPLIPLREHLTNEMEKLGKGILEFVRQARESSVEEDKRGSGDRRPNRCADCRFLASIPLPDGCFDRRCKDPYQGRGGREVSKQCAQAGPAPDWCAVVELHGKQVCKSDMEVPRG